MRFRVPRLGCMSIAMLLVALVVVIAAIMLRPRSLPDPEPLPLAVAQEERVDLRPVAAFSEITDPDARSLALFQEAGRVIEHPRCLNCHPRTDRPTQAASMRRHIPAVSRGSDGGGDPLLRCSTCHNDANLDASGVPGNPKWRLAPIEQAWQGRTLGEICRQILDSSRSHMTRAQLLHHMANDELVGWAWHPGGDRSPAPGSQAQFGALIAAWLETGAQCPA